MVLYEGLPHQSWEYRSYTNELSSKAIIKLGGFPFYAEPLLLREDDARELRSFYCERSSFKPFSGVRDCGGYHPDYALEWSNGAKRFVVQICFGCQEMKTFANGKELYCDVTPKAFKQFESVLKHYRKNRPQTER